MSEKVGRDHAATDGGADRGVVATGSYLPRFRLEADEVREAWGRSPGVSSARVPAADEDALTMAIAAAESALAEAEGAGGARTVDPGDLTYLGIATTTPPVEEGAFASRAVRALGLPADLRTEAVTQDTAAGADVLAAAAAVEGPALAVAADAPEAEPGTTDAGMGAGAAAFLFDDVGGTDADDVPRLVDRADHADEYPGVRFRERGSTAVDAIDITSYERGAITDSVAAAAGGLSVDPASVTGVAVHQPTPKLAGRVVGVLPYDGVERRGAVADAVGDLGAADVPLALLDALAGAGSADVTVCAFFGGGARAVALAFEGGGTTAPDLGGGESLSYARYLRERGHVVSGEVAGGGAHVSLPTWRRSLDARYRLAAGECRECDALTFPPEGACRRCGSREAFERVELPREGRVAASTVIGQGGAPPEFGPQQERDGPFGVAIVEFERDGETVQLPAQLTDCDPGSVEIGDRVRAAIRRIYEDEGVARYGAKFVPV